MQCVTGFNNSGNSITVTWNRATTAGNLLVVFAVAAKAYLTYPAGWNASGIESISNLTSEDNLWRYDAPSETTVTFANAGGTSGGVAWVACEFSGVLTSSAEDKAVVSTGTSNPMTTGSTGTLAQANELVTACLYVAKDDRTFSSPTNGFTIAGQATTNGATYPCAMCVTYKTVAATTSISTAVTDSTSGDAYGTGIFSWKN